MGRVECTDAGVTLAEQGPQVEDQLLRHRPRLKKPPSGGSNFGAASASPPSRFERLTSLKPPALPGDIYWFSTVIYVTSGCVLFDIDAMIVHLSQGCSKVA